MSPLGNPAWGWELVQRGVQQIALPGGEPVLVQKILVQKGLAQQLVLYWHQQGETILPEKHRPWQVCGRDVSIRPGASKTPII